ncbi:hypothetical protein [Thaumasiovibrio sp. DFM-14]|uniref:hypothetical protein n=1 Tax=Thaumasiovibrio sp. DFM-14 TaxID=3384792 RepID=UPI0039A21E22
MDITLEELNVITGHLSTKPEIADALRYHLIDGMSMYGAEQKAGATSNSLAAKVRRVEKELRYIQRFNEAGLKLEQQYRINM